MFLLGILYHLQNPYYALRELAGIADHCLLSTRVARFAGPERRRSPLPVAYLVAPHETNNDASNYWIFSPAGLERIVAARRMDRCWSGQTAGNVDASDPSSPEHDERMFMLLRAGRL